jgi:hypothetical protein
MCPNGENPPWDYEHSRASFIGRRPHRTPYNDSDQDNDHDADQDPKDGAKKTTRYGDVPGYQINAAHSRVNAK